VLGAALLGSVVGAAGLEPWSVVKALLDALPGVSVDSGLTEVETNILFEIRLPVSCWCHRRCSSRRGGLVPKVLRNALAGSVPPRRGLPGQSQYNRCVPER
jgi:hypothetical protein